MISVAYFSASRGQYDLSSVTLYFSRYGFNGAMQCFADAGVVPSPFDCYLVIRSLKTLPLRLRHQMKRCLKVSQFLESHPLVTKVLCPWLPSHPQHELAKRQTSGYTSMISFYVKGGLQETSALLKKLQIINMAGSLGGVESLAEIP